MKNISLYIHVPFCKSKCRYCDFYSIRYNHDLADVYIEAIKKEYKGVTDELSLHDSLINTIFIGGGTPSILTLAQWEKIGKFINQLNLSKTLEWTVECNPDSFTVELGAMLKDIGVTRLTFGVQTLSDPELAIAGRVHTAARALEVLNSPILGEFDSIGADIMYGLPGQTVSSLVWSLLSIIQTSYIKHCSVYELTLCEDTPFGRHQKRLPFPDDDAIFDMTKEIGSILQSSGFEHYEVSNYAKTKYRCLHNEVYWDHGNYIGLGAAAHSYFHPQRWANVSDVFTYTNSVAGRKFIIDFNETIDNEMLAREMLFLGLRRIDGINELIFEQKIGIPFAAWTDREVLKKFIDKNWLRYEKPWYRVTQEGLFFADKMARDLV